MKNNLDLILHYFNKKDNVFNLTIINIKKIES